jgi:hypothetical protein
VWQVLAAHMTEHKAMRRKAEAQAQVHHQKWSSSHRVDTQPGGGGRMGSLLTSGRPTKEQLQAVLRQVRRELSAPAGDNGWGLPTSETLQRCLALLNEHDAKSWWICGLSEEHMDHMIGVEDMLATSKAMDQEQPIDGLARDSGDVLEDSSQRMVISADGDEGDTDDTLGRDHLEDEAQQQEEEAEEQEEDVAQLQGEAEEEETDGGDGGGGAGGGGAEGGAGEEEPFLQDGPTGDASANGQTKLGAEHETLPPEGEEPRAEPEDEASLAREEQLIDEEVAAAIYFRVRNHASPSRPNTSPSRPRTPDEQPPAEPALAPDFGSDFVTDSTLNRRREHEVARRSAEVAERPPFKDIAVTKLVGDAVLRQQQAEAMRGRKAPYRDRNSRRRRGATTALWRQCRRPVI